MRIDHVLWRTTDLDAAVAHFAREHDLHATGGGRHEGQGTHNRVIPLGGGYLELIAVADAEEAAASPFGAAIAAAPEGLMAWAVSVEGVAVHAARLSVAVSTVARAGLTARLAGVEQALGNPIVPFFIERDLNIADPGADGGSGGIARIELTGDRNVLNGWLGGGSLPVHVRPGPSAVRAVHLGSGAIIR
ncbi:MAG: VOC family protein [Actinomycetota bacterium]|nr:VOC family protein [Actinomycetota bacterium]